MAMSLLTFLGVALVLICTPGPDTALTIRNAIAGGRRTGLGTAAGVAVGQLVWSAAAAFGVAALLQASQLAFEVLRWAGAAYLVLLGVRSLRDALRRRATLQPIEPAGRTTFGALQAGRQGLISNLANPKMPAFFLSLLPQFLPSGASHVIGFVVLGAIFAGLTFLWLTAYSLLIHRMRTLFQRSRVRRALDATTGVVLVTLGVRVATEQAA